MNLQATIRLRQIAAYADGVIYDSPAEPVGMDWYQYSLGPYPIPDDHAPSLKNPIKTKIPLAQDGWHQGDSKAARDQALSDLAELHRRMRRQIGKPEVAHTALFPVHPSIFDWQ